jgi:hypothetical protein
MTVEIATAADIYAELGITTPTDNQTTIIANGLISVLGKIRKYLGYDPCYGSHIEFHPQQPFQAQIQRGIWEVMEQRATLRQVAEAATNEMQLRHLPVRSMINVWVDYDGRSGSQTGAFGDGALKTEGTDYWANFDGYDSGGNRVSRDGIIRTIGLWPTTPGTIKVQYYAGYTAEEFQGSDPELDASPIREVLIDEVTRKARRTFVQQKNKMGIVAGIMTNEKLGDYSYSIDAKSIERLWGGEITGENKEKLSAFVNMGAQIGM